MVLGTDALLKLPHARPAKALFWSSVKLARAQGPLQDGNRPQKPLGWKLDFSDV